MAVFVLLPLIDLLTGYMISYDLLAAGSVASPSQWGRILLVYILVTYSLRHMGITSYIFVLLAFCFLTEIIAGILVGSLSGFIFGVVTLSKMMCFVLACCISIPSLQERLKVFTMFKIGVGLMGLSIVIAFLTSTGEPTYGSGGFGTKGFFASGNAIGVFLGTSLLILIHVWRSNKTLVSLPLLLLLLGSLVLVSSKTALIYAVMSLIFLLIGQGIRASKLIVYCIILVMLVALVDFAKVFQIGEVILEIILSRYNNADGDILLFLGSGRFGFLTDAFIQSERDFSLVKLIMGGGAFASFQDYSSVKMADFIEMDGFDVLFMYGLPGITLYGLSWSMLLYRNRQFNLVTLACLMLLLHSLIAGHVFFNGLLIQLVIVINVICSLDGKVVGNDNFRRKVQVNYDGPS
jgi:hypothetical protein